MKVPLLCIWPVFTCIFHIWFTWYWHEDVVNGVNPGASSRVQLRKKVSTLSNLNVVQWSFSSSFFFFFLPVPWWSQNCWGSLCRFPPLLRWWDVGLKRQTRKLDKRWSGWFSENVCWWVRKEWGKFFSLHGEKPLVAGFSQVVQRFIFRGQPLKIFLK